ncbi:hypothetical protein BBL94_03225 [Vibrio parahaemolyticus]|nr:hypothetical protein BBL82_15420 [Vibrio parahaemolyticus]ODW53200.1 hypothetical protein BBL87_14875 [Vibrio parahaemolyticus]ODW97944.1 hypothetical protein BBL94_03225 [Vibrio parahaemolyticus]
MPNLKLWFEVDYRFANSVFVCVEKLKSGAVSKRLSLKLLGTYSVVKNGLTTLKSSFGQTMLHNQLSAYKSVSETEDPNRTRNQRTIITNPNG